MSRKNIVPSTLGNQFFSKNINSDRHFDRKLCNMDTGGCECGWIVTDVESNFQLLSERSYMGVDNTDKLL